MGTKFYASPFSGSSSYKAGNQALSSPFQPTATDRYTSASALNINIASKSATPFVFGQCDDELEDIDIDIYTSTDTPFSLIRMRPPNAMSYETASATFIGGSANRNTTSYSTDGKLSIIGLPFHGRPKIFDRKIYGYDTLSNIRLCSLNYYDIQDDGAKIYRSNYHDVRDFLADASIKKPGDVQGAYIQKRTLLNCENADFSRPISTTFEFSVDRVEFEGHYGSMDDYMLLAFPFTRVSRGADLLPGYVVPRYITKWDCDMYRLVVSIDFGSREEIDSSFLEVGPLGFATVVPKYMGYASTQA